MRVTRRKLGCFAHDAFGIALHNAVCCGEAVLYPPCWRDEGKNSLPAFIKGHVGPGQLVAVALQLGGLFFKFLDMIEPVPGTAVRIAQVAWRVAQALAGTEYCAGLLAKLVLSFHQNTDAKIAAGDDCQTNEKALIRNDDVLGIVFDSGGGKRVAARGRDRAAFFCRRFQFVRAVPDVCRRCSDLWKLGGRGEPLHRDFQPVRIDGCGADERG